MRRTALPMTLLLALVSLALAQGYKGQGKAGGLVTDEAGNPLQGVLVKLFSVKGQSGFETTTNAEGEWKAPYIRGGTWNIDFEKEGYLPKKLAAEFKEFDRNPPVEVKLARIEGFVILEALMEGVDRGNRLFDEQKYEEAARVFEDLTAKDPNAYILHKNIGNCYFQLQNYELAEQHYLKVLDKEPDNAEIMMLVGNTYSNRKDQVKALEWYGRIDIQKITDPTALFNIATFFFSQSSFEEALKYCRRAVEIQPDSTDALYLKGLISLNLGNNQDAIAAFEHYLELAPDSEKAGQVRSFLEFLKKKTGV
ncbi:MAG: tetratricopeptide repeat protein [Candidatus Aminicenantes bacterium]|nr:tetratricopeptide repeat protein [Candidatus Aminicenantes bacterium]